MYFKSFPQQFIVYLTLCHILSDGANSKIVLEFVNQNAI